MNKLHHILITLFFSFLSIPHLSAQATTTAIAVKQGYPTFIIGLHTKVNDFLKKVEIAMRLHIDDLRSKSLDYRADTLTQQYKELYFDLEEEFDETFEQIGRKLLSGSDKLDLEQSSEKEKVRFVQTMKDDAETTITHLIHKKESLLKNDILKY